MIGDIFLSFESERTLLIGERCVFVVSSALNIVALFCLIRQTPPHQREIRTYLLFIQATVVVSDVYLCFLFEPVPVLQVFAGYCIGLLCQVMQPNVVVGMYAIVIGATATAICLCIVHRHQAIVTRGRWVISHGFGLALNWVIAAIFCIPCIAFTTTSSNQTDADRLIEMCSVDVKWIKGRGGYFMLERNLIMLMFIFAAVMLMLLFILISAASFVHMLVVLETENGKSAKMKRMTRNSLIRFAIQIFIPILFVAIPMILLMLEILFDCFSFDFCIFLTSIIPFHPVVHNLILILIVREYRSFLASYLWRSAKGSQPDRLSGCTVKVIPSR